MHAHSYVLLFATLEKHIGRGAVVGCSGEDRSLKDVSEIAGMPRCRCGKKMRLRSDGWKRCYRCGKEVMGQRLRIELGRRLMEQDGIVCDAAPSATAPPSTYNTRPRAVWRSEQ